MGSIGMGSRGVKNFREQIREAVSAHIEQYIDRPDAYRVMRQIFDAEVAEQSLARSHKMVFTAKRLGITFRSLKDKLRRGQ